MYSGREEPADSFLLDLGQNSSVEISIRLDFDEHRRIDEPADFDHCGGRSDLAEELAVGFASLVPFGDVGQVHASPDNVGH